MKWLNGRVYTRNAQHALSWGGEGEAQLSPRGEFENSAMRNEATIKVFSPAAVNKHASQPHKFRPDRCYLLLNQIFVDPSFVQIHRVLCIPSLFLSLSRHNYTLYHVLTGNDRVCDSNDTRLLISTSGNVKTVWHFQVKYLWAYM